MNALLPYLTRWLGSLMTTTLTAILALNLAMAANTDDAQLKKQHQQQSIAPERKEILDKTTSANHVAIPLRPGNQIQIDLDDYLQMMKNETIVATAMSTLVIKENGADLMHDVNKKFGVPENPVARVIPERRFSLWSELTLTEKAYAAKILGYTETTWETGWRNAVETYPYPDLDQNMKIALGQLGISATQWDCHVNHYYGYCWDELTELGIHTYFVMLGWNRESWDGNGTEPDVEGMTWSELSEMQQVIVNEICYFEETWDELPMTEWLLDWRLDKMSNTMRKGSSSTSKGVLQ